MPPIDPIRGHSPSPSTRINPGGAPPVGSDGRGGRRGYGFGPKERRLYEFLRARAAKKTVALRHVALWRVVKYVWGRDADGRRKRRFLVRLRQLQLAVNRKLEQAGDSRRIRAAREGFLTLVHLDDLPGRKKNNAAQGPGASLPGGRVAGEKGERCRQHLLECLERGVRRSEQLRRHCHDEGYSRRAFFDARRRLELRPVRRRDAAGYFWEVVWPVPEPPDPAVPSQHPEGDTLRPNPKEPPGPA